MAGLFGTSSLRAAAVVLGMALGARPALAADATAPAAEDAKTLINEGSAQYALGHFKEALADFEKVYLMKRVPALLFNIAQCHRQMKNFEEAAVTFRSFIRLAPDSPQVGNARELLSQVEEAIRAQRAAQTTPPLDENGRDVSMNLATPPIPSNLNAAMIPPPSAPSAPVPLAPGAAATNSGAAAGGAKTPGATGELAKSSAPGAAATSGDASKTLVASAAGTHAGGASAPPASTAAPLATDAAHPAAERRPFYAWIVGGAGVVALGAGGAFGLMSKSTANSLTSTPHSRADISSLQSQLSSQAGTANALFIVGAALLAAGGVLYVLKF